MYSLDVVIKKFISIVENLKKNKKNNISIYQDTKLQYYGTIVKYLKLEHKYQDIVEKSGKPIYHYFKYDLPVQDAAYFEFLYNRYNPVRFAIETFDSIEEIRLELNKYN